MTDSISVFLLGFGASIIMTSIAIVSFWVSYEREKRRIRRF